MTTEGVAGRMIRLALALVLVAGFAASPGGVRAAAAQGPAQQDEFVPLGELPPDEQLPAAPLVIAAYAAAWLVIFAYVWSLWRRLGRVEREIASVAQRVDGSAREPRRGGHGVASPQPHGGEGG